MEDLLHYVGQSLTILATWLNRISSPIPWPLVIAFLFLPLVMTLRISLWILRGRVWPVACMYYHTQQRREDRPCRVLVPGEWKYCHHHKHAKVMSDGHCCDPALNRWEERVGGAKRERSDIRGVGFISLLSNRNTLLFHKGIARRPGTVVKDLPEVWRQFIQGFRNFNGLSIRRIFSASTHGPVGVSARMPRVVRATRTTLVAFGIGLVLTGVSVILSHVSQALTQYTATTAFMVAWNSLRFGIWRDPTIEPRWIRTTAVDTGKGISVFIGLALISLLLTNLNAAAQNNDQTPAPTPRPSMTGHQPGR